MKDAVLEYRNFGQPVLGPPTPGVSDLFVFLACRTFAAGFSSSFTLRVLKSSNPRAVAQKATENSASESRRKQLIDPVK
jgi:hypothetical protein